MIHAHPVLFTLVVMGVYFLAYYVDRFLRDINSVAPKLPSEPPAPIEGAHGAYVEPEHVKFKREAYARKRSTFRPIVRFKVKKLDGDIQDLCNHIEQNTPKE